MHHRLDVAAEKLAWMRREGIWPNGTRYLWTDAFGVVLLVSMYHATGKTRFLDEAEWVIGEVDRVLGRPAGIRIGEAPDRGGQYYHYLAMWIYALDQLGRVRPGYRERAIALVRTIHPAFVLPGVGVYWKMREDLSGPAPGFGYGALDAFHGYVVYRLLAPDALADAIAEMRHLVEDAYRSLHITQDLGLGMMLWLTHFFPDEPWAACQRSRCLATLDDLWVDPPGYFCREPYLDHVRFAFTNYGVSLGLQAVGEHEARVRRLHTFFATHPGDEYADDAITHVMACAAHFPGTLLAPARRALANT